ncbi:MAG: CoA pyrophosphatase [Sphingomonadales bacterium]|nr:MAG: CoA pyrophosphatase [Sphingomonadales bacterium]TNF03962.1 MAG: CoA pyrophosphatase [Sphingomonadales bacterium]
MKLAARLRTALQQGHSRTISIIDEDQRIRQPMRFAPAAVLIAITDRPEPGVILTQRASHLRKHAGQVAFPGGRIDEQDEDAIAAALREAEEEITLPPGQVEIIGTSDSYRTFTGFDIMPVIGVIPPDLPFRPHEAEVETLFEVPLDFLLSPANRARKEVLFSGALHQYYEILWEEHRIWGVTAAIIANLSKRLGYDGNDPA